MWLVYHFKLQMAFIFPSVESECSLLRSQLSAICITMYGLNCYLTLFQPTDYGEFSITYAYSRAHNVSALCCQFTTLNYRWHLFFHLWRVNAHFCGLNTESDQGNNSKHQKLAYILWQSSSNACSYCLLDSAWWA